MATSSSLTSHSLPTQRKGRRGKTFGALLTVPGETTDALPTRSVKSDSSANKTHTHKVSGSRPNPNLNAKPKNINKSNNKNQPTSSPSTDHRSCVGKEQSKPAGSPAAVQNDPTDGGDLCLICAGSIKYYALGACSHRTCHICLLRMRALYKKQECALCKTELPQVIFTTDAQAPFNSYDLSKLEFKDPYLSIYCETFEQLDELLAHLKFNCPHPDCSSVLNNWHDLKFHTRSSHGLMLCEICCSHKKVFAHEHTLFTYKGLSVHLNRGSVGIGKGLRGSASKDDVTGDEDVEDDGFTGHPRCDFCATHFYDDDQLYRHCREKHEQCFICVRNGFGRWRYYLDYKHLESHFRDDHYLCTHVKCLQTGFMVYETALDLQAHQIEAHGADMGMRAIKDARKLEVNFNYSGSTESQTQASSRPNREQRPGRGIVAMDIAPLQTGAPTVVPNSNRIVPGLGSNHGRSGNRKPDKGKSKSTSTETADDCAIQSSSVDSDGVGQGSSRSTSDLELEHHATLLKRVSEAVNGAEAKIASFKVAIRMYRNHEMAASDLLDNLCNIFEHRSETIGSILSNLLDLLDIEDERKEHLLEKWLDLKIGVKSQYPSLGGNVENSQRSSIGLESNDVKFLSASSWVRQKPKYSKLLEAPKKNRNQDVPGLSAKARSVGGQRQTAWSSGANSQSVAVKVPAKSASNRPPPVAANSSPSVLSGSNPVNTHFPSLPTKPKPSLDQGWRARNIRDGDSKRSTLPNEDRGWANAANQVISRTNGVSSSSNINPSPMAPTGGKKAKKIVLFTNTR